MVGRNKRLKRIVVGREERLIGFETLRMKELESVEGVMLE